MFAGPGQVDQEAVQGWSGESVGKTWYGRRRSAQLRGVQGAFREGGQEEKGHWEEVARKSDPTSLSQGWCSVLHHPELNVPAKFAPNKYIKPSICRIQFDIILNKLYLRLKRISASNPQMKRYFISICIWQFFQMYFLQYNWANVFSVKL